jgi:hypothetical protein
MLSASSSSAEANEDVVRLITLLKKPCFHPGCLQQCNGRTNGNTELYKVNTTHHITSSGRIH